MAGTVIRPGDEGYEEARRVYNAMIDGGRAAIVRLRDAEDVVAAVVRARENGAGPGGPRWRAQRAGLRHRRRRVVADLSGDAAVARRPDAARTARAGGGATWGDFNDATHAHGLATTGGIISTTGVGGLTLGGGIGYLGRGYGLSCDNLRLGARS